MKTQFNNTGRLIILLAAVVWASGCSSNRSVVSPREDAPLEVVDGGYVMTAEDNTNQSNIMVHPNKDQPSNLTLDLMMRKLPGVRVSGRGQGATVVVTGMASSFIADTSPLFVVNGNTVGSNFSHLYSIVSPNDIVSMSVLKGSDASIYGTRGANGVIVIRTK